MKALLKKCTLKILKSIGIILFVIIISVAIKLFVFEIYFIPSSSMENTLFEGDIILVSKLHYGAKFPSNPKEIPILNLFCNLSGIGQKYVNSTNWDYKRSASLSSLKRGDVLVYQSISASKKKTFFVKRCVALPGDTISLQDSFLKINGEFEKESNSLKINYFVSGKNKSLMKQYIDSLNIQLGDIINDIGKGSKRANIVYRLTRKQATDLKNNSIAENVRIAIQELDSVSGNSKYWPYRKGKYNLDNYEPVVIPYKGECLRIDSSNINGFKTILTKYEGLQLNSLGEMNSNKEPQIIHFLKYNYYFLLGDNRHYSIDSRMEGPICEKQVVGKAVLVLFSFDKYKEGLSKIRLNRLFKIIK